MKTLPILLGLGAIVLIGSQKKESSKETKKELNLKLDAKKVGTSKCTSTEYLNKDGLCQVFWDETTPAQVAKKIDSVTATYKDKSWDNLCQAGKDTGDGIPPNINQIKILKEVVSDLWKPITKDMLPPTDKSPVWVIEIWKKCVAVYFDKLCGIKDGLPPIT